MGNKSRGRHWRAGLALLAAAMAGGCVSLGTYRDLEEKYEHVVDAKLAMDREYAESRRELLAVQEQHAKLAGEIAGLEKTVEGKIQAAIGPWAAEVAKLQAERTTALRERAREEAAREESRRLILERLDRLSADLDRVADRVTRTEVATARATRALLDPTRSKPKPAAATPDKPATPSPAGSADRETPNTEAEASALPAPAKPAEKHKEAAKARTNSPGGESLDPSVTPPPPPPILGSSAPRADASPLARGTR